MSEITCKQMAKLPKWAREIIATLSRQRDEAIRTRDYVLGKQGISAFHYDLDLDHKCYIPTRQVTVTHEGKQFMFGLDNNERLKLYANNNCLIVMPQASNVIAVNSER